MRNSHGALVTGIVDNVRHALNRHRLSRVPTIRRERQHHRPSAINQHRRRITRHHRHLHVMSRLARQLDCPRTRIRTVLFHCHSRLRHHHTRSVIIRHHHRHRLARHRHAAVTGDNTRKRDHRVGLVNLISLRHNRHSRRPRRLTRQDHDIERVDRCHTNTTSLGGGHSHRLGNTKGSSALHRGSDSHITACAGRRLGDLGRRHRQPDPRRGRVIIGHRHRHRPASPPLIVRINRRSRMRNSRGALVAEIIDIIRHALNRHRLSRVPTTRRERQHHFRPQRPRPGLHLHRRRITRRDRHPHIVGRPARQHHRPRTRIRAVLSHRHSRLTNNHTSGSHRK